jgi:hypothetical protein
VREALGVLFPEALQPQPAPESEPGYADAARSGGRRAVYVAIQVAAVCIGTVVLLLRIAGVPAWDSVYAEDQGVWLVDALARPWHLLVPFGGSRYSTMPIMAMTAAAVSRSMPTCAAGPWPRAAIGFRSSADRPGRSSPSSPWSACWRSAGSPIYRYVTERTSPPWGHWKPRAEQLLTACEHSTSGDITTWMWGNKTIIIPCSGLHR